MTWDPQKAERVAREIDRDVIGNRASCFCENCIDGRAKLKANARSAAEQLRAAIAEIGRLRSRECEACGTMAICVEKTACDRDKLSARVKELESLAGEACAEADDLWQRLYTRNELLEVGESSPRIAAIRASLEKP